MLYKEMLVPTQHYSHVGLAAPAFAMHHWPIIRSWYQIASDVNYDTNIMLRE